MKNYKKIHLTFLSFVMMLGLLNAADNITVGSRITIKASEIQISDGEFLDKFTSKIKAYAKPINNSSDTIPLKVLTQPSDSSQLEEVKLYLQKKVLLMNKKLIKTAYKAGKSASTIEEGKAVEFECHIIYNDKDYTIPRIFNLMPPKIEDITDMKGVHLENMPTPSQNIKVIGDFFGSKKPKVWLEYLNSEKNKIKPLKCKIIKPFEYKNSKGVMGKSCMDIDSGESSISIVLPKKFPLGWNPENANIVLQNKSAFTTISLPVDINQYYSIMGKITGVNGISGVLLKCQNTDPNFLESTTTDETGTYKFENLLPDTYIITPELANFTYIPASQTVTLDNSNILDVNFISQENSSTEYLLTVNNGIGSGQYAENDLVNISATVPAGKIFKEWAGDIQYIADTTAASTTLTMPAQNITVTAIFDDPPANTYSLSGTVSGDIQQGVTVSVNTTHSTVTDASGNYTISGLADGAYTVTPTLAGYTFTPATANAAISGADVTGLDFIAAQNTAPQYVLTVNGGTGSGQYAENDSVNISATVPAGQVFDAWTGDTQYLADATAASTTVTMPPQNITVTATFKQAPPNTHSLSGTVSGDIQQGVTVSVDATHSATTDASGNYTISGLADGAYTVTPTLAGYTFSPATANATVAGADVTGVDFSAVQNTAPQFSLTVNGGTGSGQYAENDSVNISATVPAGQVFDAWTGDTQYLADATAASTTVTMPSQNITVTATFKQAPPNTHSLSGTVSGDIQQGVTVSVDATHSATTDASGNYIINGLIDGSYTVTPTLAGYTFTPATANATISGADVTGVDFTSATTGTGTDVPTSIAGCVLWLDGADPAGDGTAVTGALQSWQDKSGKNNNAEQSDTNMQPNVLAGELNGHSVLSFDGVDDSLNFTKITDIKTVFWVLKEENQTTDSSNFHFLLGDDEKYDFHRGTGTLWNSTYVADGIKNGVTRVDRADFDGLTANIPADQYVIVSLVASADLIASQITKDRDIGRSWDGGIAEIIIYNQALSDTDRDTVENYLYNKWFGGTAPATYSISGTVSGDVQQGVAVAVDATHSATTDANGNYTISGLADGTYTVTPTLAGYVFTPATASATVAGADVTGIDFTAAQNTAPQYVLTVNDGTGSGSYAENDSVNISATAPVGKIFKEWTGDTQYLADASAASTTVTMPAQNITVTATFDDTPQNTYSLSGTVFGEKKEGIKVSVDANNYAVTDSEGHYSISNLQPGAYTIIPELANYTFSPTSYTKTITDSNIENIDFCIDINTAGAYSLSVDHGSGTGLYDENDIIQICADVTEGFLFDRWVGDTQYISDVSNPYTSVTMPAKDIAITALLKDITQRGPLYIKGTISGDIKQGVAIAVDDGMHSSVTNENGIYLMYQFSPGTYTITPVLEGYTFTPANQTVTISNKNADNIDFTAEKITVNEQLHTLTVNNGNGGGQYPKGTHVFISATIPGNKIFTQWNGDINYVYDINQPGTYVVMPDKDISVTPEFNDASSNTYSINGSIHGDIEQGVQVSLNSGETTTSDSNGKFAFSGLQNGNYIITALLDNYSFTIDNNEIIINGSDVNNIDFTSTANATPPTPGTYTVTGSIFGTLADNIQIECNNSMTPLDDSGTYEISSLPNGVYTLTPKRHGLLFFPEKRVVTINGSGFSNVNFDAYADPSIFFRLTVLGGLGSGYYHLGDKVEISPAISSELLKFKSWFGRTEFIDDVNVPNVNFTMPAENITISAELESLPYSAPNVKIISPVMNSSFQTAESINFDAEASDEDGTISSYQWTSDIDGSIGNSEDLSLNTLSEGRHFIKFTATDNDGHSASAFTYITISPNSDLVNSTVVDFFNWGYSKNEDVNFSSMAERDEVHTGFPFRNGRDPLNIYLWARGRILLVSNIQPSYFVYYFDSQGGTDPDKAVNLTASDAAINLSVSGGSPFNFHAMVFDGTSWFYSTEQTTAEISTQNPIMIADTQWKRIIESSDMHKRFPSGAMPSTLTFEDGSPDLANIKGAGIAFDLVPGAATINAAIRKIGVYSHFQNDGIGVYAGFNEYSEVSPYVFGICYTANWPLSSDLMSYLNEWCNIMRFPGGLNIETFDHKHQSRDGGKPALWIEKVRESIPRMECIVGCSATLGMHTSTITPEMCNNGLNGWTNAYGGTLPTAGEFGGGLVDYMNVHYNQDWGTNPPHKASTNFKFFEIGNEWEGGHFNIGSIVPRPDYSDLYRISLEDYYNAIYQVDPNVKILGPSCMKNQLTGIARNVMKSSGDKIDILTSHRYHTDPNTYKPDIKMLRCIVKQYGKDSPKRKKEDIKYGFTEYNGHYSGNTWQMAIWQAQVFSYFLKYGVYIATIWHIRMGPEHTLYPIYNGKHVPNPEHYSLRFFREHINFLKNPKSTHCFMKNKNLNAVAIEMSDRIVLFVTNPTYMPISLDVSFKNASFENTVKFDSLTEGFNGDWDCGVESSQIKQISNGSVNVTFQPESINALTIFHEDNTAIIPVPKLENDFYDWYKRHDEVKALIKKKNNVDLVFIGDSITHMFGGEPTGDIVRGGEVWNEYYGNRKVINMGFGWDRTQNVLWRIEHGEWDGISPKVAVVLIGTNNLKGTKNARQNTPTEIVEGISEVCEAIHKKSSKTQIILLAILPRAEKSYVDMIRDINKQVALLGEKSYITVLDLTEKFEGINGFPKEELMTDKVHPNAAGYRVWANTMEPLLSKLLGD